MGLVLEPRYEICCEVIPKIRLKARRPGGGPGQPRGLDGDGLASPRRFGHRHFAQLPQTWCSARLVPAPSQYQTE